MYQSLSSREALAPCDLTKGAGGVDVRADMLTTRIRCWPDRSQPAASGGWRGRVNDRLETNGVMWGYVPLTRHFSPTACSA